MTEIVLAIGVFALALVGLSIGVLLGKRTPLKGSCGAVVANHSAVKDELQVCDSCTCGGDHSF